MYNCINLWYRYYFHKLLTNLLKSFKPFLIKGTVVMKNENANVLHLIVSIYGTLWAVVTSIYLSLAG